MKRLAMVVMSALAFMATFLAYVNAASACFYGWYEPEVPPSLRK
ncbi:cyclic lactone autoinducer peptide [Moorella sulfitireducens (nom. illeg.)]|nr:cyclic lactone autoinducer peptide [Moorella sulfitireducens]